MTNDDKPVEVQQAWQARLRRDLGELDYRRAIRTLAQQYSPKQIQQWVNLAPGSEDAVVANANEVTPVLDGFSGATPYEICQRYSVGLIDRDQLIDELTRYPYVPGDKTIDIFDTILVDPPGTKNEVYDALSDGLIDAGIYDELFAASQKAPADD